MCQLPLKKRNIGKKKPNNFFMPTASKKIHISKISQSGNPEWKILTVAILFE